MKRFLVLLIFITMLSNHQVHSQNFLQRMVQSIKPTRAQENMLIASGTKFLADQAFKNLHIIIPAGLIGSISLKAMQEIQEENFFLSQAISWVAGALGQVAVVRHLEDIPSEEPKSFMERLGGCLMSASISALVYRIGADYVIELVPNTMGSFASSGLMVISILAGTYTTIKTSYIAGKCAQRLLRWGRECLIKVCGEHRERGPVLPLVRQNHSD